MAKADAARTAAAAVKVNGSVGLSKAYGSGGNSSFFGNNLSSGTLVNYAENAARAKAEYEQAKSAAFDSGWAAAKAAGVGTYKGPIVPRID